MIKKKRGAVKKSAESDWKTLMGNYGIVFLSMAPVQLGESHCGQRGALLAGRTIPLNQEDEDDIQSESVMMYARCKMV